MKITIEALREQLAVMEDDAARQEATVHAFAQAGEADDDAMMVAIARLVVGDDGGNEPYSKGWQMFCLQGLTEHCVERFIHAVEHESGQEAAWQDLVECLWKFKWILPKLPQDLQLSRKDIEAYNALMAGHYEWVQFSSSAVHKSLMLQNMYLGDVEKAKACYQQWQNSEVDESVDCPACEQTEVVNYHYFTGAYRKAVAHAEPIFFGGLTCADVPHITFYPVIASMIEIGQWADASHVWQGAIDVIETDMTRHIALLAPLLQLGLRLGESERVSALLDAHFETLVRHFSNKPFQYLQYLMVAAYFDDDAKAQAHHLAEAFDRRNGNHYYRHRLSALLQRPDVQ